MKEDTMNNIKDNSPAETGNASELGMFVVSLVLFALIFIPLLVL